MNFSLRQIQAFAAVARLRSFSRAAEEIHITQAGLSLMVKELEDQLGFRLLNRTTRTVSLTGAGAKFLPIVTRAMREIEEASAQLARNEEQASHFLSVAATPLVCGSVLPGVLRELRTAHPHLQVTVKDSERGSIRTLVEAGEVDIGLGILLKSGAGIQREQLHQLTLVCVAPQDRPLRKRRAANAGTVNWTELSAEPLIALPPANALQQLIDSQLEKFGRANEPRQTYNNLLTVIAMVEAGLGCAVLPSFVREACRRYEVRVLDLAHPHVSIDLYAITRRGVAVPAAGPLFLDAFKRRLAEMEDGD